MLADVAEAQRLRVLDQHAQHAAAARQVADRPVRRLVDAAGDERSSSVRSSFEHSQRRVAGAGQLAGRLEDAVQDDALLQIRHQRPPHLQQAPTP